MTSARVKFVILHHYCEHLIDRHVFPGLFIHSLSNLWHIARLISKMVRSIVVQREFGMLSLRTFSPMNLMLAGSSKTFIVSFPSLFPVLITKASGLQLANARKEACLLSDSRLLYKKNELRHKINFY